MNYYIGDTHFGDDRVMKLTERPFSSVEEMNETIMKNWNMRIHQKDTVYILGDFALDDDSASIMESLNGKKRLILGNHDRTLTKRILRQFDSVTTIRTIDDCGRSVCLCHYPLLSYENSVYGGYQVFGHIHNNMNDIAFSLQQRLPRSFNCSADVIGLTPRTLDELISMKKEGQI